jgi:flagellar hook-associated protein 2
VATIRSPGIGSGLDINSLVQQLVAAERAPYATQITRRETKATLQISALGTLKGALSTFKSALDPLKTEGAFNPRTTTSADTNVFTATATSSAAVGTYEIEVVSLAKSHQLASGPFADGSTAIVGTGTLTITQGDQSFEVVIDSESNTLAGIRNAINAAAGNTGVQATLLNEENGSRLVLTSTKTGEDYAIRVTASGGDGGLDALVYDPGNQTNLSELRAATDAHIRIAGFDHFSSTNTVSGAIDGVTLTLKAESDGPVTLTVANDDAMLLDRVKRFVSEYNKLNESLARLRSYTPATRQAGPLLGDPLLRGIEDELRAGLVDPVSGLTGNYTMLATLGITRQLDGTLALDEAKFNAALAEDRRAVAAVFGSENGVAARLAKTLEARLRSDSAIETRNKALQSEVERIQREKEALDARMLVVEERYRRQFTALDALLSRMQSVSGFLASQLASLPKPDSIKD